jgi:hypothetical protein
MDDQIKKVSKPDKRTRAEKRRAFKEDKLNKAIASGEVRYVAIKKPNPKQTW